MKKNSNLKKLIKLVIVFICILAIGSWLLIYDSYTNKKSVRVGYDDVTSNKEYKNNDNIKNEENNNSQIKVTEYTPKPSVEKITTDKNKNTSKPKIIKHPQKNKKVAIDAGHQSKGNSNTEPDGPGSDNYKAKVMGGATGVGSSVPEYKLTLNIAKKLRKELISRGYDVYMIRKSNNVNISNMERAIAANKSGADICIRIHADGSNDSDVTGASALYPTVSNPYVGYLSKKSKRLSECIINEYCKETGIKNRGLSERDDLTGTNWSKIPVTLLEMGFLTNYAEDEKMQDLSFQRSMVLGIANGIDSYFSN